MFSEVTEICENPLYFCSWLAAHLARWKQNAAHRACVEIEVRRGSKDGQTSRLSRSKTCCLGENFCHKLWQGTPGSLVSFWRPIFASVEFVHQNRTALKFFSWQLCMPELSDVSKDDWLTNLYFIELELSFHNHPLIVELLFVFFFYPEQPLGVLADLKVWELQRRTTMFHDDWRAPFLPHDGQKPHGWIEMGERLKGILLFDRRHQL